MVEGEGGDHLCVFLKTQVLPFLSLHPFLCLHHVQQVNLFRCSDRGVDN